jgi:hypothetical protein
MFALVFFGYSAKIAKKIKFTLGRKNKLFQFLPISLVKKSTKAILFVWTLSDSTDDLMVVP